ncbi:lamin tail domain-containing protein [Salegentibacter sp. HM20]
MKNYYLIFFIFLIACSDEDPALEFLVDGSSRASDLFFSEYIEGSSFNKALEIVNLTGNSLDLSNYSIKKQQNGSGDWMSEFKLEGMLNDGDVFVIANANSDLEDILEAANILKNGAPLDFNGNDPIGLFKDGNLLDVIGEFNNSENFGMDLSLRRKKSAQVPNTNFDAGEWEVFEMNTTNDLGKY